MMRLPRLSLLPVNLYYSATVDTRPPLGDFHQHDEPNRQRPTRINDQTRDENTVAHRPPMRTLRTHGPYGAQNNERIRNQNR